MHHMASSLGILPAAHVFIAAFYLATIAQKATGVNEKRREKPAFFPLPQYVVVADFAYRGAKREELFEIAREIMVPVEEKFWEDRENGLP